MAAHIKEISSKAFVVVMEVGEVISKEERVIRVITHQIRNKVMDCIVGIMDGHIKAIFRMTFEMVMVSYLIHMAMYRIRVNGKMVIKLVKMKEKATIKTTNITIHKIIIYQRSCIQNMSNRVAINLPNQKIHYESAKLNMYKNYNRS
jgi:hypothetical protein